jgi:hypothetical protein
LLVIAHATNTYCTPLTEETNHVKFTIMAKKTKSTSSIERKHKGTSAGRPGNLTKTSSMNKHKKRSFKIYRGQGRP